MKARKTVPNRWKEAALTPIVLGLTVAACWQSTYAVDEVSYIAGAKTLKLSGVAVDGRSYYDVVLTATGGSLSEFSVTEAAATDQPGAASYQSSTTKLTIPSVRYQDSSTSGVRRYSVEMTLSGVNPVRFKFFRAVENDRTYVDSPEAAKAAAWLRLAPPADNASSHFGVIGVQSFNGLGRTAETVLSTLGPASFYQNTTALQEARNTIASRVAAQGPVMQAGGITAVRDVQNLPWGMIEPSEGTYDFTLMDSLVQAYQAYGVDYVGVTMPFASWDLASKSLAPAKCQHFFTEDFKYLAAAGKMDRYVNLDAFLTMLQTSVERYDGDGVNDMAGLFRPVKYWQLQNEPEGADCGQFGDDVGSYVEFMRGGYNAVKTACSSCQVLNGGVGLVDKTKSRGSFWWTYAALGGTDYIDVNTVHFNEGKSSGTQDVSEFETRLTNVKDALGSDKPIWVTEFGVMVNLPNGQFVSMTETQAAAWFTRFYAAGLTAGVKRFFSDAPTFINIAGKTQTLLLPYYTNKLLEAKLGGFTAATKLGTGQYRFTVNGRSVYVLSSGVPGELAGAVTSYDIYGTETIGLASSLNPTQSSPLIVVK